MSAAVRLTTESGADVTEGVQAAYDLVLSSMNWGSGFLTVEDVEPLARLALACGYDTEPIAEYLAAPALPQRYQFWNKPAEYEAARENALARARALIEELRS